MRCDCMYRILAIAFKAQLIEIQRIWLFTRFIWCKDARVEIKLTQNRLSNKSKFWKLVFFTRSFRLCTHFDYPFCTLNAKKTTDTERKECAIFVSRCAVFDSLTHNIQFCVTFFYFKEIKRIVPNKNEEERQYRMSANSSGAQTVNMIKKKNNKKICSQKRKTNE